jgi:predicted metal-dependent HD superfamily phosphohydrolase
MNVFNGLLVAYSESHRHYHVLGHIVSMLDEFEEVRHLSHNPHAVLFAVWCHDYIYDTEKPSSSTMSNEKRSAYYGGKELEKIGIPRGLRNEVQRLVLLTDHKQHAYDVDAQILLDLDLAILGKEESVFDEYELSVRKEYSWVPESTFKSQRRKILRLFFSHSPLYSTSYFTNHKEEFCLEKNGNIVEILKREDENFIAVVSSRNFNYKTEKYIQDKGFSEVISIPSSIKLCMIAEGSVDVYPKFGSTMEWDTAAGQALILGCGGKVVDMDGGRNLEYRKAGFCNHEFLVTL